jgi:hypothetical protein
MFSFYFLVDANKLKEQLAARILEVQLFAGKRKALAGTATTNQPFGEADFILPELRVKNTFKVMHFGNVPDMNNIRPVGFTYLYGIFIDLAGKVPLNGYPCTVEGYTAT